MTGMAMALVVAAAFVHASWNYLAKRAAAVSLCLVVYGVDGGGLLSVGPGPFADSKPVLDLMSFVFILGSGLLHIAYFLILQRGYRRGDLSLVYPLARGLGPALATAMAIICLGERPSWSALMGAGMVISGVFVLTGCSRARSGGPGNAGAIWYGLMTEP
jgi:drug/metabolite transporter (DMT)-like permease